MVKAVGIQKKLDQFTDNELLWYKFHTLIDSGYYYCTDCNRILYPLQLESYQEIQLGDSKGYTKLHAKPCHSLYCVYCGKNLFPDRIKKEQQETNYCIACDRHYDTDTKFCALCGNSLGDDIVNRLIRIGQDPENSYEDFASAFMTLTNAEVVPLSIHERFMQLCDSGENEVSQMTLLQMQSPDFCSDNRIRELMLKGNKNG